MRKQKHTMKILVCIKISRKSGMRVGLFALATLKSAQSGSWPRQFGNFKTDTIFHCWGTNPRAHALRWIVHNVVKCNVNCIDPVWPSNALYHPEFRLTHPPIISLHKTGLFLCILNCLVDFSDNFFYYRPCHMCFWCKNSEWIHSVKKLYLKSQWHFHWSDISFWYWKSSATLITGLDHQRDMASQSEKVSVFSCKICNKTTKSKGTQERHFAIVHSGEKPFQCNKCQRLFAQKACEVCGKTVSDMNSHLKMHKKKLKTKEKGSICKNNILFKATIPCQSIWQNMH